ncbi:kinase [Thraustotheca clavata]|uniref:Kinase n=1 Tax=Thraustotheca clavata TaxID=74557 RepID=A0A1V9ZPU3_9STRA|nr:kinase [Thraustotheca clavata]
MKQQATKEVIDTADSKIPNEKSISPATSKVKLDSIQHTAPCNLNNILEALVHEGDTGRLLNYIKSGGDPNVVNEAGDTLNHIAVKANQSTTADFLLSVPNVAISVDNTCFLGSGGFGCVYNGAVNGEEVAVKTAHKGYEKNLIDEISIMMKCHSPYIVDIVAVSQDSHNPNLALQLMDCGNLQGYLRNKLSGKETPINVTFEVAWAVSNALADLHLSSTVHRDHKSQNILLSTKHYIKLGNLGISREFAKINRTAPEILRGESYDYPADIYSFGAGGIVEGVKNRSLRPCLSDTCEPWLKELADKCLLHDPKQRPSAQNIVDFLKFQLQSDITCLAQPDRESQYSAHSTFYSNESTTANSLISNDLSS